MLGLERQVRQAGFDGRLLDLVRMRASQVNGCAYCLDMRSKDARAEGETEQRLYGLDAWRETPCTIRETPDYSARERAALEWTEALTLVSETRVPDEVYQRVREQFSEDELGAPRAWPVVSNSTAGTGSTSLRARCPATGRGRQCREGARVTLISRTQGSLICSADSGGV